MEALLNFNLFIWLVAIIALTNAGTFLLVWFAPLQATGEEVEYKRKWVRKEGKKTIWSLK